MAEPPVQISQAPPTLQYGHSGARSSALVLLAGIFGFLLCLSGPFTGLVLYRAIEWLRGRLQMPVSIAMIEPMILGMALEFIAVLLGLMEPRRAGKNLGYLALSGAVIGTIWFTLLFVGATSG